MTESVKKKNNRKLIDDLRTRLPIGKFKRNIQFSLLIVFILNQLLLLDSLSFWILLHGTDTKAFEGPNEIIKLHYHVNTE